MRVVGLLPAAVILLLPLPAFAQGWVEYASRADFFSVNFPGQPKVEEIAWISENEAKYPGCVYSVGDGKTISYETVYSNRYPHPRRSR